MPSRPSLFAGLIGEDEEAGSSYTDTSNQPSILQRARTAAGLEPTRREEMADACCPQLTFTQRLYGFGICFGVGCLISLGSMAFFHQLLAGKPAPFAVNYTLGNSLELGSTMFLMGPARQLKRMTSPTRLGAATLYVGAMVATLFSALVMPGLTHWSAGTCAVVTLVCIIVQFFAMFWYALSYIPYGRRACRACCTSLLSEQGE